METPRASERLESWKAIAEYLKKGERTVRRWEDTERLPVHRHQHEGRSTVYAFPAELDAWLVAREAPPPAVETPINTEPQRHRWPPRRAALAAAAVLGLLAAGTAYYKRTQVAGVPAILDVVPLTSFRGEESFPSFFPDGGKVAFVWAPAGGNPDVYIMTIGSEKPQQITNTPEPERSSVVSPDGSKILFLRIQGDRSSVVLYDVPSGRERKVADTFSPHISFYGAPGPFLSWFPDSKRAVVVNRMRLPGPTTLFTLDTTTGALTQLTNPPASSWGDSEPAVSPDGETVLFSRSITPGFNDLFKIAASGSGAEELVLSNKQWNCCPSWMPDGKAIVFTSGYWGHVGLFRLAMTRRGMPEPLASGGGAFHATVSPSGQLAFMRYQHVQEIWRIPLRAAGRAAGPAVPVIASSRAEVNAHVSPDNRWIVYVSDRSGSNEIWIARADGSEPRRITNFAGPPAGSPRWSPDGNRIVFDATFDGMRDICVVDRDGRNLQRLTAEPGSDVVPRWSADGTFIYFGSKRSGDYQIWRIPAAGGEAVQITHDGGVVAEPSIDGKWLYYTKTDNNSNALYRAPLSGGAEALVLDAVFARRFAVTESGVYYQPAATDPPIVAFKDAASGTVTQVGVTKEPTVGPLSVSGDEKYLYFTKMGTANSDLVIVPRF